MKKTSGSRNREFLRSVFIGALVGTGISIAFFSGFFLRDFVDLEVSSAARQQSGDDYSLIYEVDGLIREHYLRELPTPTERQYAAIRGMLSTLGDPNTFFIDPPVARSESQVLAGTYGGIGINVSRDEAGRFVIYPFPDSPASNAGFQNGDILVAINGQELDLQTQVDAVDQMLRGEVKDGNGVEVTVNRGVAEITEFLAFDIINVPSVLWRVLEEDDRVGYLQIMRFTSRTPEEVDIAIRGLLGEGIIALVLDLRDNSGGLLQESIEVVDSFLDGGDVVFEVSNADEKVFSADPGGSAVELNPLVVIVNHRTASAAELVAGAIQDQERGILVGQQTFGKGTIQQIFPLSDSSSVHITSAEWLTPNRHALDSVGLTPDIVMIPDENGRDIEIGEALRHIRSFLESSDTGTNE